MNRGIKFLVFIPLFKLTLFIINPCLNRERIKNLQPQKILLRQKLDLSKPWNQNTSYLKQAIGCIGRTKKIVCIKNVYDIQLCFRVQMVCMVRTMIITLLRAWTTNYNRKNYPDIIAQEYFNHKLYLKKLCIPTTWGGRQNNELFLLAFFASVYS